MSMLLLGRKQGMTKIFGEHGEVVPITVIQLTSAVVAAKKNLEKDGYDALQVGYEDVKEKLLRKPQIEFYKKCKLSPKRYLRESKVDKKVYDKYNVGDAVVIDFLDKGKYVDVTAKSIGKGFAGVIKRWGFAGGKKTHGSMFHRAPGSIGASADPARVMKGKKMPGHMGNKRSTVQNLQIIDFIKDTNLIYVKGSIPGSNGVLVEVRIAKKKVS